MADVIDDSDCGKEPEEIEETEDIEKPKDSENSEETDGWFK